MKVFEQLSDKQLLRRAVLCEVNFSDKLPYKQGHNEPPECRASLVQMRR